MKITFLCVVATKVKLFEDKKATEGHIKGYTKQMLFF